MFRQNVKTIEGSNHAILGVIEIGSVIVPTVP